MVAQRVPYLACDGVLSGRVRETENIDRPDSVNLPCIEQAPDGMQWTRSRPPDDGGIRDQVKAPSSASDANVEHTQSAEVTLGYPPPAVLHEIEDHGIKFPSLKPVRGPNLYLRARPRLV